MKKIFIIAIALVAMLLTACEKFLDVVPQGNYSTDSYFQNDEQSINAIKAIYEDFPTEQIYGRDIFFEQCASCMYVVGKTRGFSNMFYLNYNSNGSDSPLSNSYNKIYMYISRCNWIVNSLYQKEKGGSKLTEIENRTLGEAYFFRAYYHFLIAYRYGAEKQGVPFVQWEKIEGGYNYEIPEQLASVNDNYALIIEDFTAAKARLPKFETYVPADRGRAHQAAAVGMMARVYSYWATFDKEQWKNVISCVDELETTYQRGLAENYDQNFSNDFADYWNKEYVFSIPGNGGGTTDAGSMFPNVPFYNGGFEGAFNSWGQFSPTYDVYEEFLKDGPRESNVRLKRSILAYGDEITYNGKTFGMYEDKDLATGFMCGKYRDVYEKGTIAEIQKEGLLGTNGDWPTMRVNFHVIRFADCLLLRAEAKYALGQDGSSDINKVRARAGLAPFIGSAWEAIWHERLCELYFEPIADRLGDLRRWIVGGDPEIKNLALHEITTHPRIILYENRSNSDPNQPHQIVPYEDYKDEVHAWDADNHKAVFPYPQTEIDKSDGKLKQNAGY